MTKPYPPLYLGGGPAGFRRIAQLGAGWMSISASAGALSVELERLRDMAGRDVPVISSRIGALTVKALEEYRDLGIEHLTAELPTEPRDQTLRRLDELHTTFGKLA